MEPQENKQAVNTTWLGAITLICATITSFIISVTVDMTGFELGALFNYFLPPIIGLLTIIIYLITCWISKNVTVRIIVCLILFLYNLYAGVQLRKTYVPFPF